jgi:two-component system cell cycle response regulator
MSGDPTSTDRSAKADAPSPEPDCSQCTVLIVDDNAQNVELLQAYLEALGCETITAPDGLEAIRMVEDEGRALPDLILLDVMMPKMSGFEVCRRLKSGPRTAKIPVMMVTALNELGDIERGVESGTDEFVTKPVNRSELITRVKSLLRVRHLERELDRTTAYLEAIDRRDQPSDPSPAETGEGDQAAEA